MGVTCSSFAPIAFAQSGLNASNGYIINDNGQLKFKIGKNPNSDSTIITMGKVSKVIGQKDHPNTTDCKDKKQNIYAPEESSTGASLFTMHINGEKETYTVNNVTGYEKKPDGTTDYTKPIIDGKKEEKINII